MSTSFYGWFTAGINDEQTSASTTWSSEKISEELAKSNSVIPSPAPDDAGKVLVVSEDGNSYELKTPSSEIPPEQLEQINTNKENIEQISMQLNEINENFPVPTEADNGKVLTVVDGKWTASIPEVDLRSWKNIQLIVRSGLARQYFPVGYEFVTHDNTEDADIVWVVRGYDTIQAADESLSHTMILETKYAYSDKNGAYVSLDFDSEELLYFCENQLEAGTYHFTLLDGYEETYGGGKTYSFTLTQPVPAGGVILFPWTATTQASETDIVTYASVSSKSAIETTQVTEGANGTLLGTADGNTPSMNHTHRIHYGSNNYAQSAIRQWLNSPKAAGKVWEAQTKFDRPPKWENTQAGFLAGLPEDFLSVIQTAIVQCQTNSIFEVDSLDGTVYTIGQTYNLEDRFFILSRVEVDGTYENTQYQDGMQLDFYDGLSSSERIPYGPNGSAYTKRLRTAANTDASLTVIVNTSGNISNTSARLRTAVFPACIIA